MDLRLAGLVIQPFQTVAEYIFILSVGPKRSVNPPPLFVLQKYSYLLTYLVVLAGVNGGQWTHSRNYE